MQKAHSSVKPTNAINLGTWCCYKNMNVGIFLISINKFEINM